MCYRAATFIMALAITKISPFQSNLFRFSKQIIHLRSSSLTCKSIASLSFEKQCLLTAPVLTLKASKQDFHTSASQEKWEMKNLRKFPPQKPGEPRRPAEMFYSKKNIKHSKRKMWYAASFVKGMMIDDAITQLNYVNKKAAQIVREVLLEAQKEAVEKHNVEYKSNLHIAASFTTRARSEHAMRYHAKGRSSILDLVYCHYFVCLREGPPPEKPHFTGYDQAEDYLKLLRQRRLGDSL